MIRLRTSLWLGLMGVFAGGCIPAASGAAPTLEHFYPVAATLGTTQAVQMIGAPGTWPPQVWVDAPGIVFRPQTNSGVFNVELASNAPAGPHWVRLHNGEGASAARFFVVDTVAQTAEVEPNDEFLKPQSVQSLPAVINGRLDKSGDVDSFAVDVQAGQTLVARLEAYLLASPVDAVLRVLDPDQVQVALNHDDGVTFDPRVTWKATATGRHIVQVFGFAYPAGSDVRFSGGGSSVYRLHLSTGPVIQHALPLGMVPGSNTLHQLVGWNLPESATASDFGAPLGPADGRGVVHVKVAHAPDSFGVVIGKGTEILEQEPNDTPAQAPLLSLPFAVTGTIGKSGDQDRFRFHAEKGERFWIEVKSASLGVPLDSWLKVEDATGKELVRNDDTANADPATEWVAPAAGDYLVAVGNLLHQGGSNLLYRLSLEKPSPTLTATVAAQSFVLKAGETNVVKVALRRQFGFASKVRVTVEGTPTDLIAPPVDVDGQQAEASLSWTTRSNALAFSGPIRIRISDTNSHLLTTAAFPVISSGSDNGVPNGFGRLLIESLEALWLNIIPAPPPVKK